MKAKCKNGFDLYAFFNRSYYDMVTVRCRGEDRCDCKERDFVLLAEAKAEYEKGGKVLEVEYDET
jgi:hypothetical protein